MPYKDQQKEREAAAERMRRYRQRKADDVEWKRKEAERKAAWYATPQGKQKKAAAQLAWQQTPEGKKKMADAQRRYQARKRSVKKS